MRSALAFATLALVTAAAPALRAQGVDGGVPPVAADAGVPIFAADAGMADAGVADAGVAADGGTAILPSAPSAPTGEAAPMSNLPVPETGKIARIVVQGNRRVETDAIRAVLPLKVADTYDKKKLRAVLIAVWKMNYFSDVKLDVSPLPAGQPGYQLTVLVAEKPAVHEVKLEGNDELNKDDFKDSMEVKQFQILDMELVRKTQKKIQEKYIEKGFFLAEVSTR